MFILKSSILELIKFTFVNKEIVSRIEAVIEHLDLSVSAFADEIGVQRSSISHLLNGRNKPSLDFVMKLVSTYPEVGLDWLLKGEGSFPKKTSDQIKEEANRNTEETVEQVTDAVDVKTPPTINKTSKHNKEPYKIVMFYPDGTFATFNPKND